MKDQVPTLKEKLLLARENKVDISLDNQEINRLCDMLGYPRDIGLKETIPQQNHQIIFYKEINQKTFIKKRIIAHGIKRGDFYREICLVNGKQIKTQEFDNLLTRSEGNSS